MKSINIIAFFFILKLGIAILLTCAYAKSPQEEEQNLPLKIISARAIDKNHIQVDFENENFTLSVKDVKINADINISRLHSKKRSILLQTTDLDYRKNYFVEIIKYSKVPVDMSVMLDNIFSRKPLGCSTENNHTNFRLFAPRANSVKLVVFEKHTDNTGREFDMTNGDGGVWEYSLEGTYWGKYYGFKVDGPRDSTEIFEPEQVIADPYSLAVSTKNSYLHEAKSIILKNHDYDWEEDTPLRIAWQDLIIYEMHIRDMTVHPSAGVSEKGTYRGLVERGTKGGINHILDLGVNAVELLPCQEFGNIEIPYMQNVNGVNNTWNPYARNHWGYMTSYFFAPESYYASGGNLNTGEYCGAHGQQINEFKDMVKAFHKAGTAVIMDVVYNHVSQYDWNPLKYIDKKYYFRLDPMMNFIKTSGCGNDFKTERPMAQRLIIDSIKYWLEEYHIDGFRFDLATLMDWETVEKITEEAEKINSDVILIAEPWGGGKYDLGGFSDRDWAAWNDLIRNGVKGQNPYNGLGWIFGHYQGDNNSNTMKRYIRGSIRDFGGPFVTKKHSINYLESHDDHTLGDFIRIATGAVKPDQKINDLTANARLTEKQMKLHKLAASFLLTSQGPVMIGEGQEFARSKVVASTDASDSHVGQIDHNSYNKDNETNWLNFEHKELNQELFDYYKGLLELRNEHPAFRRMPPKEILFLKSTTDHSLGYFLSKTPSGDSRNFVVLMNASPDRPAQFTLPKGRWQKVVDEKRAGKTAFGQIFQETIIIPSASASVLVN